MSNTPEILLTKEYYRTIALCVLIGMVGFFDFVVFWHHSDIISLVFFTKDIGSFYQSLYLTGLFASGYLSRPLGGWLIGRYGDRYGRLPAILLCLLGISLFTLLIALLPDYEQVGILAAFLFITLRLGQGIAFGSQLPTLWVYLTEKLPIHSIGLGTGLVVSGIVLSNIFVLMLLTLLDTLLTHSELLSYGWRLPYIIGGLLGIGLLYFANKLKETPVFLTCSKKQAYQPSQKITLKHKWQGIIPILVLSWFIGSVVIILSFLLHDLIKLSFDINAALLSVSVVLCLIFLGIGSVFFGFLTDRVNTGKIIAIGSVLFTLSLFYLFYDLNNGGKFILLSLALVGFFGGVIGAMPVIMTRLCPARHRLSTVCIGYNVIYAVLGVLLPPSLGFLSYYAEFTPAVYLSFVAMMALFLSFYIQDNPRNQSELYQ